MCQAIPEYALCPRCTEKIGEPKFEWEACQDVLNRLTHNVMFPCSQGPPLAANKEKFYFASVVCLPCKWNEEYGREDWEFTLGVQFVEENRWEYVQTEDSVNKVADVADEMEDPVSDDEWANGLKAIAAEMDEPASEMDEAANEVDIVVETASEGYDWAGESDEAASESVEAAKGNSKPEKPKKVTQLTAGLINKYQSKEKGQAKSMDEMRAEHEANLAKRREIAKEKREGVLNQGLKQGDKDAASILNPGRVFKSGQGPESGQATRASKKNIKRGLGLKAGKKARLVPKSGQGTKAGKRVKGGLGLKAGKKARLAPKSGQGMKAGKRVEEGLGLKAGKKASLTHKSGQGTQAGNSIEGGQGLKTGYMTRLAVKAGQSTENGQSTTAKQGTKAGSDAGQTTKTSQGKKTGPKVVQKLGLGPKASQGTEAGGISKVSKGYRTRAAVQALQGATFSRAGRLLKSGKKTSED